MTIKKCLLSGLLGGLCLLFSSTGLSYTKNKSSHKLKLDGDRGGVHLSNLDENSILKNTGGKKKRKRRKSSRGRYRTYARKSSNSYIKNLVYVDSLVEYASKQGMDYLSFLNLLYSTYNCKAFNYWKMYFPKNHDSYVANYFNSKCAIVGRIIETNYENIEFIDSILIKHHIPKEMKYLAVIESYLNVRAFSRVGAAGAWQFMKPTGRLMGLKINSRTDERRNLQKSTIAAAKYIRKLYDEFHDWLLVVAAYNCGPGNMRRAIRRAGTDNIWSVKKYLPRETRGHIKKFVATYILMELMLKNGNSHVLQSPFMASISKTPNVLEHILQETPNLGILSKPPVYDSRTPLFSNLPSKEFENQIL